MIISKYQIVFYICLMSVLIFVVSANFESQIWEFAYFYSSRIAMLTIGFILKERSRNPYEKKLSSLLINLFIRLFIWEIIATVSWDFANSAVVLFLLFISVFYLLGRLFVWMYKNNKNAGSNHYT
jgi:hypothetical protein